MAEARPFWSQSAETLLGTLGSSKEGLSSATAEERLASIGPNRLDGGEKASMLRLLLHQFSSPIVLLLLFAAVLSGFLRDLPDAVIITAIILASGLLSFAEERGAADAVSKLLALVAIRARVVRDGAETDVELERVVPGDVVLLSAGDTIPGDCAVLSANALFADESALTGESFPVEKQTGMLDPDTPLSGRTNALFMGTHVVSGEARAVVVHTGRDTEFGHVSEHLRGARDETEFEHGVRRFGYLLMEVTLVLVIAIFAINVFMSRPVLTSFMFALALAVGLTPQLLPAIISINLASGARAMATHKVIVKRLASIENFGSMDVLCADKTGTLTEGKVQLDSALDWQGKLSERTLALAFVNSSFETGFDNPIDAAVRSAGSLDLSGYRKLDEEPYDFQRKRLSVLVEHDGERLMVTKGALSGVLAVCTDVEDPGGGSIALDDRRAEIEATAASLAERGLRTLGVCYRTGLPADRIGKDDEVAMTFVGLLAFLDPPKAGVAEAVRDLAVLGIELKVITGDAAAVAASLASKVGMDSARILTGREIEKMTDTALAVQARDAGIFAEIEPTQKERLIRSLRSGKRVVGYIGDGINDAPALHAADVSISVNSAVDVAKEAADIVLLEQGLDVLAAGVRAGRRTFANTLKYVFMATSANFGNMFSMAGGSLFLPFLPLLPTQVLLTNLLTDMPELTIASDTVDAELVKVPRRWDVRFIRDFMLVFGPLSSVFDFVTFGVLMLLHAGTGEFRTGWFTESVISASLIVLVIRTRRPFWRSRPSTRLASATGGIALVTLALPYTPAGPLFRLTALPPVFYAALGGVLVAYVAGAEVVKAWFYRRFDVSPASLPPRTHEAEETA